MRERIEQIVNEMPEGFLWWEGCGHEAGILMDEAIEFATKIHNEAIELAARELHPELRDMISRGHAADIVRKLKVE